MIMKVSDSLLEEFYEYQTQNYLLIFDPLIDLRIGSFSEISEKRCKPAGDSSKIQLKIIKSSCRSRVKDAMVISGYHGREITT